MIKISNVFCDIKEISEKDTYGYFSIGCIDLSSCNNLLGIGEEFIASKLGCVCEINGESFKVSLYRINLTDKYIVLSDFSNIPDLAVINSDEVLEALKPEVIKYITGYERVVTNNTRETYNSAIDFSQQWIVSPVTYSSEFYSNIDDIY